MTPQHSLDTWFQALQKASNVADLETPMVALTKHISEQETILLSDLWSIANNVGDCARRICQLTDLGDGDDHEEQSNRGKIGNWFGNFAQTLAFRFNMHSIAANILTTLWNEIGEYQRQVNTKPSQLKHIYRAGIAMYIGRIFTEREPGTAVWWLLHAHADDLLNRHDMHGGAARDMLRLSFAMNQNVFDYMETCADESLNSAEEHHWFAEHLVMRLSLRQEFSNLFGFPTRLVEFPIGRSYARCLLDRVKEASEGKYLEELARYLFLLIAGWVPTQNIYHYRTRIDSDLIARYTREPEAISSAHGRAILVECKNIDSTLGVSEVGYFLYRMYLTRVNVGVLMAKRNVTGVSRHDVITEHRNAEHLIDLAHQRDGSAVIVLDIDDLDALTSEKITIWSLVDSRIVERRFGKPASGE